MSGAFTDADYERMVRERDEALARVDSQRSLIAFYRTACTARFLPDGSGDETIRELIKELTEERDEARALVDELRGQYQYSVGLSMALEERDKARRERDEARAEVERLRAEADRWKRSCNVFRERDWPHAFQVTVTRLEREVSDAHVQLARLRRLSKPWEGDAYHRGAEAMREACQQWCRAWENDGEAIADALADLQVEDP